MLVPGVRHGLHVPRSLVPLLLALSAVVIAVVAWAALSSRQSGTELAATPAAPLATVRSIAYTVPAGGADRLMVRKAVPGATPELVAVFPHFPGLHARGAASPLGDQVAVLSVTTGTYASLSVVDVRAREIASVPGSFDYLSAIGMANILAHEQAVVDYALDRLSEVPGLTLYGPAPERRNGVATFTLADIHAHDIAQLLDAEGVAIRAGHHCAMPLHQRLGVAATARASFYLYNTQHEVDALIDALDRARRVFGR